MDVEGEEAKDRSGAIGSGGFAGAAGGTGGEVGAGGEVGRGGATLRTCRGRDGRRDGRGETCRATGFGIDGARACAGCAVVCAGTRRGARTLRTAARLLTAGRRGAAARTTVEADPAAASAGCELPGLIASSQTTAKTEPETAAEIPKAVRTREKVSLMESSLPPDNTIRFESAPAASL